MYEGTIRRDVFQILTLGLNNVYLYNNINMLFTKNNKNTNLVWDCGLAISDI